MLNVYIIIIVLLNDIFEYTFIVLNLVPEKNVPNAIKYFLMLL